MVFQTLFKEYHRTFVFPVYFSLCVNLPSFQMLYIYVLQLLQSKNPRVCFCCKTRKICTQGSQPHKVIEKNLFLKSQNTLSTQLCFIISTSQFALLLFKSPLHKNESECFSMIKFCLETFFEG